MDPLTLNHRASGLLLGTAVGDAIGLHREGLSARRAARMFGAAPLKHGFICGRGMCSDDTEHACMTAQALIASGGDPARFARSLAWRLRGWFVCLPAGVGMATARATLKLWAGFPPSRSGVWSAGNGPTMRAATLGLYAADDLELLRKLVHACTRITHSDPAAEHGALAIALAAACVARQSTADPRIEFATLIRTELHGTPMYALLENVLADLIAGRSFEQYLAMQGQTKGVSGYINHTVPAVIFCWLKWQNDFRSEVEAIILAGGDTDTTGAIVGALVGCQLGAESIPKQWVDGIVEYPRTQKWIRRLAATLSASASRRGEPKRPVKLFWPALPLRNAVFLVVVLLHGLRRMLPPY